MILLLGIACTPMMGRLDLSSPAAARTVRGPEVGASVRFAVLGDFGHHEGGAIPPHSREVLTEVGRACTDCDFVVLPGDNLYPNGVPRSGDTRFLDALADALEPPLLVTLGNHDWGAFWWPFGGANRKRAQRELDWIARRDDVLGSAHFWSLDAGPVRFIALDSTYLVRRCRPRSDEEIRCRGGSDPVAMLRPKLDGHRWTVAITHHPWLSDGWHGDAGSFSDPVVSLGRGRAYRALLETLAPDLVVSGHDHHTQVISHQDSLLVVSGGGSEQRPVRRRDRTSWVLDDAPGFVIATITAEALRIEAHNGGACVGVEQLRGGEARGIPCADME